MALPKTRWRLSTAGTTENRKSKLALHSRERSSRVLAAGILSSYLRPFSRFLFPILARRVHVAQPLGMVPLVTARYIARARRRTPDQTSSPHPVIVHRAQPLRQLLFLTPLDTASLFFHTPKISTFVHNRQTVVANCQSTNSLGPETLGPVAAGTKATNISDCRPTEASGPSQRGRSTSSSGND